MLEEIIRRIRPYLLVAVQKLHFRGSRKSSLKSEVLVMCDLNNIGH